MTRLFISKSSRWTQYVGQRSNSVCLYAIVMWKVRQVALGKQRDFVLKIWHQSCHTWRDSGKYTETGK